MPDEERKDLIRRIPAREIAWRALRARGFEDDVEALGALGLRPPAAPIEGPNVEARRRGRHRSRRAPGARMSQLFALIVTAASPFLTFSLGDAN